MIHALGGQRVATKQCGGIDFTANDARVQGRQHIRLEVESLNG